MYVLVYERRHIHKQVRTNGLTRIQAEVMVGGWMKWLSGNCSYRHNIERADAIAASRLDNGMSAMSAVRLRLCATVCDDSRAVSRSFRHNIERDGGCPA